ncbi:MAG: PAS domain-containing protein [Thermoanaerobaculia bacterium]|nr:PAS domain-containing protein [Thermoanaerobaculia bacterium]
MSVTQQAAVTNLQELQQIERMGSQELDQLPFGAIRLDKDGNILSFNQHEAKLTGRDPGKVMGKNFFREVAPCTNVQEFAGKYREGVREGSLHEIFPYRFDFEMEPRDVTVTLFYSDQTKSGWVFVRESRTEG